MTVDIMRREDGAVLMFGTSPKGTCHIHRSTKRALCGQTFDVGGDPMSSAKRMCRWCAQLGLAWVRELRAP